MVEAVPGRRGSSLVTSYVRSGRLPGTSPRAPCRTCRSRSRRRTSRARSTKAFFASASGTRSCGRRGPAIDGSTSPRSSSTTCEYVRMLVGLVPEQVLLAVGLDERDALRRSGRSAAGSRASRRRPGRSRRSRRTRGSCSRASRGRRARATATPGPKYSTNFPTTPVWRRISVTVSTRSVAVAPSRSAPVSRKPTTCGTSIETASPSIAASASIPPTPQPSTPRPFTIVVCESVPTSVSGNATPSRDSITRARNSRLTWWQMPVFGGTTLKLSKAPLAPAQEGVALAVALELELDVALDREPGRELVHLHGVVDHELGRDERVDPGRVAAQLAHRVAHRGEVDDTRGRR